ECTSLDLDRPRAPGSLKHSIDFIGFFPPVRDPLSANPGMREAGIFDPCTKSGGITGRARNSVRIDSGEQSIAQSNELRRSGPAGCIVQVRDRARIGTVADNYFRGFLW